MKKPSRQESEIFFSYSGGRITPWDVGDEEILVEAANRGLKHSFEETGAHIDGQMIFESTVTQWLTRLLSDGVTEPLIEELNKMSSKIRYRRLLTLDEGGSPLWNNIANLDDIEPESSVAYAISHLLGSGAFKRLLQCQEEKCDDFFLGRPDRKWCSDRCGSRTRNRAKRKSDRESGVLPGT